MEGWQKSSKIEYIDFAKQMENLGIKTIIFTDISRDGTLSGPNFEATGKINDRVSCNIIASGGMKYIEDIKKLNEDEYIWSNYRKSTLQWKYILSRSNIRGKG